jgi:hypothetical protein
VPVPRARTLLDIDGELLLHAQPSLHSDVRGHCLISTAMVQVDDVARAAALVRAVKPWTSTTPIRCRAPLIAAYSRLAVGVSTPVNDRRRGMSASGFDARFLSGEFLNFGLKTIGLLHKLLDLGL